MSNSLYGMKIIVSPDVPKMQLAPGDYVTPEFRKEIDAWLIEFFGTWNIIPDGDVLIMETTGLINMNPRMLARLKNAL